MLNRARSGSGRNRLRNFLRRYAQARDSSGRLAQAASSAACECRFAARTAHRLSARRSAEFSESNGSQPDAPDVMQMSAENNRARSAFATTNIWVATLGCAPGAPAAATQDGRWELRIASGAGTLTQQVAACARQASRLTRCSPDQLIVLLDGGERALCTPVVV